MSTPQGRPPRPGAWLSSTPATEPPATPSTVPSPVPSATPSSAVPVEPTDGGALGTVLRDLPVAEHADVLAAEHDRLHRLLATIDQL